MADGGFSSLLQSYQTFLCKIEQKFIKKVTERNYRRSQYYRLGSRFFVNESSQFSERYSDQTQAAIKQKSLLMLGQMYYSRPS